MYRYLYYVVYVYDLQLNEEYNKNILLKDDNKNSLQPRTQTLPIKNVQNSFPIPR